MREDGHEYAELIIHVTTDGEIKRTIQRNTGPGRTAIYVSVSVYMYSVQSYYTTSPWQEALELLCIQTTMSAENCHGSGR